MLAKWRNLFFATIIVIGIGLALNTGFYAWLNWIGTPVYDVPTRAPSLTEIRLRNLIETFRQSSQEISFFDLGSILQKPIDRICIQHPKETQADFEKVTQRTVSDYHQIMHSGVAWWIFYEDKSYEPVYLGPSNLVLYRSGATGPDNKCTNFSILKLSHRTVYTSEGQKTSELNYEFADADAQ